MQDHTSDGAEPRTVVLVVGGVRCTVPAVYHHQGVLEGCLEITGRPFFADAGDSHYGHCGMVLKPAAKGTGYAALDNHGNYWEPDYNTSIGERPARIVAWAQELLRRKSGPKDADRTAPDFRGPGLAGPGTGFGDRW
ncbi:hypothetical protein ABT301_04840 [Streptomyces sp. NPDC000987]|uniref:hypothetical protein n=1 Tax=Streptomyces sp. NPDC000987 TaxID=3154374 RepID=UPI0033259478